jgi:hypothetical protein
MGRDAGRDTGRDMGRDAGRDTGRVKRGIGGGEEAVEKG